MLGLTQQDPDFLSAPDAVESIRTLEYIRTGMIIADRSIEEFRLSLGKKVLREMERRLRRLREQGLQPRLEVVTWSVSMAEAVSRFGALESAGWKGREGTAVNRTNHQGRFYTELLTRLAERGNACVYLYWFNDRRAAAQLCALAGGTLVFLKTAYDESLRQYCPGILMKHAILEDRMRDSRVKRFEFYGRVNEWQERWISHSRTMFHLTCYRWSWLARLHESVARKNAAPLDPSDDANEPSEHGSH